MSWIGEYLIGVCSAAILCAIVTGIAGNKGTVGGAVKLIAGIFMIITLFGPLLDVRLDTWDKAFSGIAQDADALAVQGENSSKVAMAAIIKKQTEAYILDKAGDLGADVAVEVTLSQDSVPVPMAVHISGNLSPYAKKQLTKLLSQDLGITEEGQTWS